MEYITENISLESSEFPFNIFNGSGHTESGTEPPYFHNHNCLELNYAVHGGGRYYIGDQVYEIKTGVFFIINNCEYHCAINDGPLILKVIVFNPEMVWQSGAGSMDYQYLKTFFEWKDNFKHHFCVDNLMVQHIATLFYEIEHEWRKKQIGYQLLIKSLLLKILAILYRGFESTSPYSFKVLDFQNKYNRIVEAIYYIDKNYQSTITLEHLAKLVHMNKNYFSEYFKNVMQIPVSAYIRKKRIANACLLLQMTKMRITDIAYAVGFSDVSYFNRVFREEHHMSPLCFRRKNLL